MAEIPLLIYTDLDGTLLDHETYDFSPAVPLLQSLAQHRIETIFCTSKTYCEVIHLREQLDNHAPFIVENGSAVYLPKWMFESRPMGSTSISAYWCYAFCPPRHHWLELIDQNRVRFDGCFEQFSTMTTERLMDLTGLTHTQAERAKARGFGEPLYWLGSDDALTEFCRTLTEQGANILTGGRFVHVSGQADKGLAMRWLTQEFERLTHSPRITIGLGDSQNDAALLDACDYAVVVKSPAQTFPRLQRKDRLYYTQAYGPKGWVEGLEHQFHQSRIPELSALLKKDNHSG